MTIDVKGFVIDGSKEPGCILSYKCPGEEWDTGLVFTSFSWQDENTLVMTFKNGDELVINITEKVSDPAIVGAVPGQTRFSFVGTAELED